MNENVFIKLKQNIIWEIVLSSARNRVKQQEKVKFWLI